MRNFIIKIILCFTFLSIAISQNYFEIAKEAYGKQEYMLARKNILLAINEKSQNVENNILAANIYFHLDSLDKSLSFITTALKKSQGEERKKSEAVANKINKLRMLLKGANKDYELGNFDVSISKYNEILLDYNNAIIYYRLGVVYKKEGMYKNAVLNFQKAIEINPFIGTYRKEITKVSKMLTKKGDEEARMREYSNALKYYQEAIEYSPMYSIAMYKLSDVYTRLKDYAPALKVLAKGAKIDEKKLSKGEITSINPKVYYKLGNAYRRMKDYELAEKNFIKAISFDENYYKAYYSLAVTYKSLNNLSLSIFNAEKAIEIKPDYEKGYILIGEVEREKSYDSDKNQKNIHLENSIDAYNKALELNERSLEALFGIAYAYNEKFNYDQAKVYSKKAISFKPTYSPAWYSLGVAEYNLNNKIAAKKAFEKASRDRYWRKSSKYYLDKIKSN